MDTHKGPTIKVRMPNGAWSERSTRDALAELGAKVLVILRSTVGGYALDRYGSPSPAKVAAIHDAARSLGLLEENGGRS